MPQVIAGATHAQTTGFDGGRERFVMSVQIRAASPRA
jgi:hypothetical protein